MSELPVRKMPGIGRVTQKILREVLRVETCGDLYAQRAVLPELFGQRTADWLLRVSLGIGRAAVGA